MTGAYRSTTSSSLLRRGAALAVASVVLACGADDAESSARRPATAISPAPATDGPDVNEPASGTDEGDLTTGSNPTASPGLESPTPPAEDPDPPPEEPEPIVVEAGSRLGPVRLGMTESEVQALGLVEAEVDPRSRRFGPYRVFFDDESTVRRVEAQMGALERIQIGDRELPAGTHIHEIRDVIGDCRWIEGGGERYRCSGGTLSVQTTHSLDPALYTISVERR